jgi:long-subunit fatty acid transport protein
VLPHRHEVKLNVVRFDVGLKYRISQQWRLEAAFPYEIKSQDASVPNIDSVDDPDQKDAMLRYQNIHHRNQTYRGISDMDLLLGYSKHGIVSKNDMLTVKLGTTIPFGKTEDDPWKLGAMGKEHLHIQFGTGTFNPIGDLRYSIPIYGGLAANASVRGKVPFYENSKTYRGSWDVTYSAGLNYRLNDWLSVQTSYLGLYQSYAHWAGDIDINTGLQFSLASLGASIATPYNVPLSITLMLPIQQETLYDDSNALLDGTYQESDAFKLGMLVSVTALYSF